MKYLLSLHRLDLEILIKRSAKVFIPGCEKFVPALAYLLPVLPGSARVLLSKICILFCQSLYYYIVQGRPAFIVRFCVTIRGPYQQAALYRARLIGGPQVW